MKHFVKNYQNMVGCLIFLILQTTLFEAHHPSRILQLLICFQGFDFMLNIEKDNCKKNTEKEGRQECFNLVNLLAQEDPR